MSDATRPVETQFGANGAAYGRTRTSPTSNTTRAQMTVPPDHVVPIVFVPGIMGSNLKNRRTGEQVWTVNSSSSVAKQWIFRGAATRQIKLSYSDVTVDDGGTLPAPTGSVRDAPAARARGWGTISNAFYGDALNWLESVLNIVHQQNGAMLTSLINNDNLGRQWHALKPFSFLSPDEAHKSINFFCPVHAVGYNWLQDNFQSGRDLATAIDRITALYAGMKASDGRPRYKCTQVILVTHSMGGLVSRAAAHPDMGKASPKIVGIIHGAMPANGAAAAYHHARAGNDGLQGLVLGSNAAQVTAIFANSPGALELLPNHQYSFNWLKATAGGSTTPLVSLPSADPYDAPIPNSQGESAAFYKERRRWWRTVDEQLVDPAKIHEKKGLDPWTQAYIPNINVTRNFHHKLGTFYHPLTYAHFGSDAKQLAYGDVVWNSDQTLSITATAARDEAPGYNSNPVSIDGKNRFGWNVPFQFQIGNPGEPGDGTVPERSGIAPASQNVKQVFKMSGFEHSGAYADLDVRMATLYCIAKILSTLPSA